MRIKTKLGNEVQLAIPKAVREYLGLHPGDYVEIEIKPAPQTNMVKNWRETARKHGGYLEKMVG